MSITVSCPACGQGYALNEALAGRRVRCKKCDNPFEIPSPETALQPEDLYGLDEAETETSAGASTPAAGFDDAFDPPMSRTAPRSTRSKPAFRARSQPSGAPPLSRFSKIGLIGAGVLLALTLISALIAPPMVMLFGMPLILLGIGLTIGGALGMLIGAFQIAPVHGVLSLVVPFYLPLFSLLNFQEMKRPLSAFGGGLALSLCLVFVMKGSAGRMNAQARREFEAISSTAEIGDGGEGATPTGVPSPTPESGAAGAIPGNEPFDSYREVFDGLLAKTRETAALIGRLSREGESPEGLEALESHTEELSAALDRFTALPPLEDEHQRRLREVFGLPFRSALAQLHGTTERALDRLPPERSPQLEEPRTLLADVAEFLELSQWGLAFTEPSRAPNQTRGRDSRALRSTPGARRFAPGARGGPRIRPFGARSARVTPDPAGPDEIVLVIANVADVETNRKLIDRLRRGLSQRGLQIRSTYSRGRRTATIRIRPIEDPQAVADRIDFGEVLSIEDRIIEIEYVP